MNPYITAKIERYNQLRSDVDAMQTRASEECRDITEAELSTIKGHAGEGKAIYDEVAPYLEEHNRSVKVAELGAKLTRSVASGGDGFEDVGSKATHPFGGGYSETVPALLPARSQVAEMLRVAQAGGNARFTVAEHTDMEHRAAVLIANVGAPARGLEFNPREPRRLAVAAGLPSQRVLWAEDVKYPRFGAGAAGTPAEGAAKPEYAAVTAATDRPVTIATWTDVSRQTLESVAGFEARLRARQGALLARREDQLLIDTLVGLGAAIPAYVAPAAETGSDSLIVAATQVLDDVGAEADVAVIPPAMVKKVFGGSVGTQGETPEAQLRLNVHGLAVYVSGAVAASTAWVGSWRAVSRMLVGLQPTWVVDAMTGLKTNTVTILAEEAVALAVEEPTGFRKITFSA